MVHNLIRTNFKSLLFILALILTLNDPSKPVYAMPTARDATIEDLFDLSQHLGKKSAPNTFVFFVNGAQDHWRPETMDHPEKWGRADAAEVIRIKELAKSCKSCNVLLLHVQRGGDRWYTPARPWATYLRAYRGGEKILTRHVSLINAADPLVVTRLLIAARQLFPGTNFHLIYRGHGFYPSYDPATTADSIAPFDINFKDTPYGIEIFIRGIEAAHLERPLSSITFAACRMSYLEIAERLSRHAQFMIASQVDIVEDLAVGFNYRFLLEIPWHSTDEITSLKIGEFLLDAFETTPDLLDNKMEAPVSVIRLDQINTLSDRMKRVFLAIHESSPEFFKMNMKMILSEFHVARSLSERQVHAYQTLHKSEADIERLGKLYRIPSLHSDEIDLISFLSWLSHQEFSLDLKEGFKTELNDILKDLRDRIRVVRPSPFSNHFGMSLDGIGLKEFSDSSSPSIKH